MRYRSLGWIGMAAWLGLWPATGHADNLSNARDAMKKGDLKTAQIELRNAIRSDPQNAEARYWLARVAIEAVAGVVGRRTVACLVPPLFHHGAHTLQRGAVIGLSDEVLDLIRIIGHAIQLLAWTRRQEDVLLMQGQSACFARRLERQIRG